MVILPALLGWKRAEDQESGPIAPCQRARPSWLGRLGLWPWRSAGAPTRSKVGRRTKRAHPRSRRSFGLGASHDEAPVRRNRDLSRGHVRRSST